VSQTDLRHDVLRASSLLTVDGLRPRQQATARWLQHEDAVELFLLVNLIEIVPSTSIKTTSAEARAFSISRRIQFARVPALAADLVRREVAVLVAAGGTVLSARAATDTVPIVAIGSIDLVEVGSCCQPQSARR
jgi:hypothetical protein